jgi:heme/copper-type cytochrome/quinol oxidase subunit 3
MSEVKRLNDPSLIFSCIFWQTTARAFALQNSTNFLEYGYPSTLVFGRKFLPLGFKLFHQFIHTGVEFPATVFDSSYGPEIQETDEFYKTEREETHCAHF